MVMELKQAHKTGIAIAFLLVVILLFGEGCGNAGTPTNTTGTNQTNKYPDIYGMEVSYCEGLGYTYEYRMNETSGSMEEYCRLSKDIECEAWAFASGKCHPEFTLCSRQGYLPRIGMEVRNNSKLTYPICIFPDGKYCKEADFFNHKCAVDWEK
jgi:putative hemolysin